jgi:hypothetical protein
MVEKFPVFLKTLSGSNYYCIMGPDHFWEWQRIGSKGSLLEVKALNLPDRWVIQDLLNNTTGNMVVIDEEEWRLVSSTS